MTDPDLVTAGDGDVIGYECPSCGTLKKTAEQARAHCTSLSAARERRRFAERCREADLDERRFINVRDGEKGTRSPGHQNPENWLAPDSPDLAGNYGIHPGPGRNQSATWLVEFDIDDYDQERDRSALDTLPRTLAVKSPHTDPDDPGHRYYAVTGDVAGALREAAGNLNPEPVWGEVKSKGKYVVGPGSRLDGCTKEWCSDCSDPDGGYYTIAADVPIATITADDLADVLRDDPDIQGRTGDSSGYVLDEDGEIDGHGWVGDEAEPPEDLPMCYRATLAARGGGASVSKHDVNVYIGLLGLNCGYEIREVVDHIREVDPGIDVSETEYHLEHIKENRYSPPALRTLASAGILPAPVCHGECPVHGGSTDSEASEQHDEDYGRQYGSEACVSPACDAEPFDREQRWHDLQGDRYDAWLNRERAHIWGDGAGTGKTTNAARAAAARGRPHIVLFDKHAKAREFITNDATPDGYFHLKGGEQPRYDCCMDATVAADESETPECPVHGHPSRWPRMNSIYKREEDDPLRERYEILVEVLGPRRALFRVAKHEGEDSDLIDENPWLDQFGELTTAERVVGVHEYQTLKTALEGELVGERDPILDETPRLLASEHRVSVEGLVRVENRLDDLAANVERRDSTLAHDCRELAAFAGRIRDAVVADEKGTLEAIDPPRFHGGEYFEVKDPISGKGTKERNLAEAAVQVKLAYNEATIRRVQEGEYNGEPFCMDPLLAAAATAGLDDEGCRKAIAIDAVLDDCPWCGADLGYDNGARCCSECGWHEHENTVTTKDDEAARATAWIDDILAGLDRDEEPALAYKSLPLASDLPDPLVLDATATPEKVAGLYGHDLDDVNVDGDEPVDLGEQLRVTQVVGGRHHGDRFHVGGQYHAQTIRDSEKLRGRIQSAIDTAGDLHNRPLFGIRKDLIPLFDFPENGVVLYYGGARGLDFEECDAVMCIGAPHPNVDDLRRDAELLAMDRDDLRVGGEEYSTRRDAPNPPIYRKLLYENQDNEGLAVPTKGYSGLVGALFREGRENELEQFVHRIRPVLADELKHAYLLTDVPTDLAVNQVVGLEELADPMEAILPVSEGAVRLLGHVLDVADGDGPDGFRRADLVEQRGDGTVGNRAAGYHRLARMFGEDVTLRTVRNWIEDLEGLGLLVPEEYEQRRGVSYAVDIATSKRALQALSCNGGFEVATKRRLAALAAELDSALAWLCRAIDLLALFGDCCSWSTVVNRGGSTPHGG